MKVWATDNTIELFAGPGGWDTGIAALGIHPVGIEWDKAACDTGRAAGHVRVQGDVALLDPLDTARMYLRPGWAQSLLGFIASPPCQGFSLAGKGRGREDSEALLAGIRSLMGFASNVSINALIRALRAEMADPRSILVLEPLRWIIALRPAWIALEQVPGVLPLWEAYAEVLESMGYSVDTGNLSSEQYGVPQVRKRAILVARSAAFTFEHGPAMLPAPTHSKFYSRTPSRLDEGLLPWVTMGDALSYAEEQLVGFPRRYDGRGESVTLNGEEYRARDLRSTALPSHVVTEKARSWKRWTPEFNDQSGTPFDAEWPFKRPATTVAGRGLVQNPGATANRYNGSTKSRNDGVKVTVEEAGILQSFPRDYPWQGTDTARYRQAGDAVPPLMALAIVSEVAAVTSTITTEGLAALV